MFVFVIAFVFVLVFVFVFVCFRIRIRVRVRDPMRVCIMFVFVCVRISVGACVRFCIRIIVCARIWEHAQSTGNGEDHLTGTEDALLSGPVCAKKKRRFSFSSHCVSCVPPSPPISMLLHVGMAWGVQKKRRFPAVPLDRTLATLNQGVWGKNSSAPRSRTENFVIFFTHTGNILRIRSIGIYVILLLFPDQCLHFRGPSGD